MQRTKKDQKSNLVSLYTQISAQLIFFLFKKNKQVKISTELYLYFEVCMLAN